MQVSLKWLKDYVDVDLSPEELADRLTMSGLEVDSLTRKEPSFRGVKVARILSIRPHPNADHLSLCDVSAGGEALPIVCGARNIRAGDTVPLAPVGATLPGGLVIRSSKIRGEQSEGMLCSEEELGVGEDASGIMQLPSDLSPGDDLADALDLGDAILDIGVTPNRSDCLSVVGVAREVAAITGKKLRYPTCDVAEGAGETSRLASVTIEDPDLCPRYAARIIRNVRIAPAPFWMRRRLEAAGLRPINNVVDVTNFVMLELGQPLHAFDFGFLEEGRIVVRRSREGEKFVSLDGKERVLKPDTLMICDGVKPVAIGGVMGGLNSEVRPETETVLLESAYFDPASIRRTARALGMGTDAAFRFERGIDPQGVVRALDRAARLMAEVSGGTVCARAIDQHPRPVETARDIPLRVRRVNDILGAAVPEEEMVHILESLGMDVRTAGGGEFRVTPPTCRVDISREIDLIEEIVRLYGYDRIPATLPSVSVASGAAAGGRARIEGRVREILAGSGYGEVINYSFISPAAVDQLGLGDSDERRLLVGIRNPLTEEQAVLRTTMLYGLLLNAKRNADSGRFDLKIFEVGRTFIRPEEGRLPRENNRMGALLAGRRYEDRWHSRELQADFYDLKGCVENILTALRVPDASFRSSVREPFLHPGRSCGVFSKEMQIGFLGEIHPQLLARMDLAGPVVGCELDLDRLSAAGSGTASFQPLPRFPSSFRDVAFLVRRELEAEELIRPARDFHEELLEKVQIFDVYDGKNLPVGMKSLGLRFSYRSAERTLTDEEVSGIHGRIVSRIVEATGASIR